MVRVARGELTYSVRYLANAWQWSPGRVQRFLDELQTDHSIDTRTDTGQTVISLCNYDTYQSPFHQVDTQTDTVSDTQSGTNKKERKRTNNNARARAADVDQGFAEWYALYPRKKQPAAASGAYRKVIESGKITRSELLARTRDLAAGWSKRPQEDRRFIPYPASWLNAGGYFDEPEIASEQAPTIAAPSMSAIDFTEADWRKRVKYSAKTGKWPETEWGPAPGKPGSLVPAALWPNTAPDDPTRP